MNINFIVGIQEKETKNCTEEEQQAGTTENTDFVAQRHR